MKKFVIMIIVLIIVFVNLYLMGLNAQKRLDTNQEEHISKNVKTLTEVEVEENSQDGTEEVVEEVKVVEEKKKTTEEVKVAEENKDTTKPKEVKKEVKKVEVPQKDAQINKEIKEEPTVIISEETKEEVFVEKEEIIVKKEDTIEEVKVAEEVKISEEYKINKGKITEIENIIKNNPTEDMLLYGYNIVVDSSIVNMTNQFTFTEKRVKDKIAWKFGTIRIYAQDYYCNGEYVCTECFII